MDCHYQGPVIRPLGPKKTYDSETDKLSSVGVARCHHGELLQGIFEEQNGKQTRGLVTLAHPALQSRAHFSFDEACSGLYVSPEHKSKALSAALLTMELLQADAWNGSLVVECEAEEELGLGSSTADVVASCRAVADALGKHLTREQIAQIAVQAEFASDPIMYESSTVLFAQHEGRVIEDLGPLLPPMCILSFTLGSPVNTCTYKLPEYGWEDLQKFKPLRGLLRYALVRNDLEGVAKVSTYSAMINQRYLPKPGFDDVLAIMEKNDISGLQIAHSGNLVGLIFSPLDRDLADKVSDSTHRLAEVGVTKVSYFEKY